MRETYMVNLVKTLPLESKTNFLPGILDVVNKLDSESDVLFHKLTHCKISI